jgi:Tfp pilus assembly protein PilN
MHSELTNLLPHDRRKTLERAYLFRLVTVSTLMLSFIIISSGALLVPSYWFERQQSNLSKQELEKLNSSLSLSGGKEVASRFNALSLDASYLARLATTSSATGAISGILAIPRSGITITGMSYSPATRGADGKMILTGNATTRGALHAFIDALGKQPFITTADLPISAYAKEKDIDFSVTLTGTLSP